MNQQIKKALIDESTSQIGEFLGLEFFGVDNKKLDELKTSLVLLLGNLESLRDETISITKEIVDKSNAKLERKMEQLIGEIELQKGEDGKDGIDAETPSDERLLSLIKPLLPKVSDGKDGKDATVNYDLIVRKVSKLIKPPKDGKNGENGKDAIFDPKAVLEAILALPEAKKLTPKHIVGLDEAMHNIARQYLHGGGDTVRAGSSITITQNPDGTKTIAFSGSGGFTKLVATGVVNGVNTSFTFLQKPTYIVSDHAWYSENNGWTWDSGTLTATMSVPPVDEIYGFV